MIPFLAAALTFVAASVATALTVLLWSDGRGLNVPIALTALGAGAAAAAGAFWHVRRMEARNTAGRPREPISPWGWLVFTAFALFALRSFCWLVYFNNDNISIGSPFNLGDLSMHMLLAREFANGVHWWPDHPEISGLSIRYYPGIDLFQALLLVLGAGDFPSLVWVGLAGSVLAALALYRWGGPFAVAGFLFAGGLAGFQFFAHGQVADYQSELAWKSLPLTMFVTQRPLLFAVPAGLLLLAHWREKFFAEQPARPAPPAAAIPAGPQTPARGLIPFWVEWLLYTAMAAFHLFTFIFLSALLGTWFVAYFRRAALRWHLLGLVGAALGPATFVVWLTTGHFSSTSIIKIQWGWMAHGKPWLDALGFWPWNFGLFALLAPALWLLCARDVGRPWLKSLLEDDPKEPPPAAPAAVGSPPPPLPPATTADGDPDTPRWPRAGDLRPAAAFVLPAGVIFLVACVVLFAPWDWDNTKLMIWCYLAVLPFLWRWLVRPLAEPLQVLVCAVLFLSGAVSLAGGLGVSHLNYKLIDRAELDAVRLMVAPLPVEARFAAVNDDRNDFNHPLVYCGRKVAVGYRGHLSSQGIDCSTTLADLDALMEGERGWEQAAARLGVRYVFWGPREQSRYPESTRPWASRQAVVAECNWGTVYELKGSGGAK